MYRGWVEVAPCTKNECGEWLIMFNAQWEYRNVGIKLVVVGQDEFVGLGENRGSVGVAQCILFTTQFYEFVSLF